MNFEQDVEEIVIIAVIPKSDKPMTLSPSSQFAQFSPYWHVNTFLWYFPWPKQCSGKFHSLLSPSLSTNNMGHMCKILNIDGQLFATHSLSYFNHYQIWWLHKCNHYTIKIDSVIYRYIYMYGSTSSLQNAYCKNSLNYFATFVDWMSQNQRIKNLFH